MTDMKSGGSDHVGGLDTIRLIAALMVAIDHFGPNYIGHFSGMGAQLAHYANIVVNLPFNGQAAVIVFFVVSGFVIHLPYASGKPFCLADFAARRFVRLVPPALIVGFAFWNLGLVPEETGWNGTVFWSLICEIIYYAIYPAILLGMRAGWFRLETVFAASAAAAVGIVFVNFDTVRVNTNFPALGYLTWICGLPSWIAGCWLAQNRHSFAAINAVPMWIVRVGMVGLGGMLMIVRSVPEVFGPLSSNIILFNAAIPAVVAWLGLEAAFNRANSGGAVQALFDRFGAASYTLYLVHMLAFSVYQFPSRAPQFLLLYLAMVAGMTLTFFITVERPCHRLARTLGRRVAGPALVR